MNSESKPNSAPHRRSSRPSKQETVKSKKDCDRFQILRKTEICKYFLEGKCPRTKEECAYAHGEDDLRVVSLDERAKHHLVPSAKKWRTELCFNYTTSGTCRYGSKCAFIHDNVANLKCLNVPVKEALDFVLHRNDPAPETASDFESLSQAYSNLTVDIPPTNQFYPTFGFVQPTTPMPPSASSPPMLYAYTPVPYSVYSRNFAPQSSYTPPLIQSRVYNYPKNGLHQTEGFVGTPYPFEKPSQNYSFDSPTAGTRSYRLFSRGGKPMKWNRASPKRQPAASKETNDEKRSTEEMQNAAAVPLEKVPVTVESNTNAVKPNTARSHDD